MPEGIGYPPGAAAPPMAPDAMPGDPTDPIKALLAKLAEMLGGGTAPAMKLPGVEQTRNSEIQELVGDGATADVPTFTPPGQGAAAAPGGNPLQALLAKLKGGA